MPSRSCIIFLVALALAQAAQADSTTSSCSPRATAPPSAALSPALSAANTARAAIEADEIAGIEARLESALNLCGPPPEACAREFLHVGRSYERLAEATEGPRAAKAQRRAADLYREARSKASTGKDARLVSYADGYLGALYAKHGRQQEAATLTRRALLGADQSRAADALYRWHWQLGRIQRAQGKMDAALASYRRAVRQLDSLRSEMAGLSADLAFTFRSEVEPVYREFVDLLLREAERGEGDTEQRRLSEARDALEALKAAELRDHFSDPCLAAQRRATPEDVPGTIVLYPVLLPDRVELIVGTDEGLSVHRSPVNGPTLIADTKRLRSLLTKRTTRQFLPAAQKVYDALIAPIDAALSGRTIRALVVVPSGPLRTIPFSALHDAKSGKFLIEKVAVAISPGLTLTNPRPIDRSQVQSLVAGISESVLGFSPLENVPSEVAKVSEAFPSVSLLNESFQSSTFEQEIAARPVGIVHVASHGEFRADASESFILAHDQKISMDRFARTVGRTRLRNEAPLELLVLSACQTATGDERAALGLAGVALRAGARSALATLWSVNDVASARLVTRFYEELAGGASRATALQRAQIQLLSDPVTRHPAYWSPYLLISSWL